MHTYVLYSKIMVDVEKIAKSGPSPARDR
jgi:hypothetical protein